MKRLKFITILLLSSVALITQGYANSNVEHVKGFVEGVSGQVIEALKKNENNTKGRKQAFKEIFAQNSDVPKIARFVSGSAWRSASKKELSAYIDAYRDYMAFTYATRITSYNNQEIEVGRIIDSGHNNYLVNTTLKSPNSAENMSVVWQVSDKNDALKVDDLRIENISMSLTQRAEFAAVLIQNNNDLSALTNILIGRLNAIK